MLITCDGCSSKIRVPDKAAGKRVKCPKCANMIRVPALETPSHPAPDSGGVSSAPLPPLPKFEPEPPEEQGTEVTSRPSSKGSKPPPIKKTSGGRTAWDDDDDDDVDIRSRRGRRDDDDDGDDDRPPRRRHDRYDDDDDDDDYDDLNVRRRRARRPTNSMATTGMVMGIVSVVSLIAPICCCGLVGCGILATLNGTLALIFGIMGKVPGSESQATTGIICGAIGLVLGLIEIALGVVFIGAHFGGRF
jgi:predicted Zn finger-like uncharacterized protein